MESLNALSLLKATSTLSDMLRNPNRATSKMTDAIDKIIGPFRLKSIKHDIDILIDLKTEIVALIKKVKNQSIKPYLEKRYLCFETWEQIAVDMDYSIQHIYRLRDRALAETTTLLKNDRKC